MKKQVTHYSRIVQKMKKEETKMSELIDAIVEALNSSDLDNKFGRPEKIDGENTIGIEFEGETYFLEVIPA